MMHVWEFDESLDTPKSYKAFCVYRDLGVSRSLSMAYAVSRGRSEGVKRAAGYFERWANNGHWQARAAAFDLHEEAIEREVRAESDRVAYLSGLEDFRGLQIRVGRSSVASLEVIRAKVFDFVENVELESLDDCEQLARIGKTLLDGSDMWAKGLCINELLENLNENT